MLWTFCPHLPSLAGDFITLPGNELSISILCFTYHQQLYKNLFPTALVCGGWNNRRPVDVEILIRARARSVGLELWIQIVWPTRAECTSKNGHPEQGISLYISRNEVHSFALCYCQLRCDDFCWSETALTVDLVVWVWSVVVGSAKSRRCNERPYTPL